MSFVYQRDPSFGLRSTPATQRTLTTVTYDTSKIPSLDLPSVSPGDPLPYVYGTRKIAQPKIFYFGNLQPLFTTETKVSTYQGTMNALQADANGYANQVIIEAGGSGDSSTPIPVPLTTGTVGASDNSKNPYLPASQQLPQRSYQVQGMLPNVVFQDQIDETVTLSDYTIDVGIAICLGPGARLQKIFAGENLLWEGDLFGYNAVENNEVGDDGGLTYPQLGRGFFFHDGAFNQAPNDYLKQTADDPTLISSLPGIAYIVIVGVASSIAKGAAYSFEIRRTPNPLALTSDVQTNGEDLNVASALVDVLTNDWGCLGIDISNIDLPAFAAAAVTFKNENLFASDMITDDSGGVTGVKSLQAMTNSLLYCDPSTGLITITLFRDTILTTTPPIMVVTPSVNTQIQGFKKPDWTVLPTSFEIDYLDRADDYQSAKLDARNPAIPPPKDRRTNKITFNEPCICDDTVAASSLLIMMKTQSSPKMTMTLIMNRSAARALPGQTLLLTWPEYGIDEVAFWIMKVREYDNNRVALDIEQYQFLAVTKYFSTPEPSGYVRKDITVKQPAAVRMVSTPLLLSRWAFPMQSSYQLSLQYDFLACLVEPANDYQANASIYDPVSGLKLQEGVNYSPTAKLADALSIAAGGFDKCVKQIVINTPVFFGALAKSQDYPRINATRQRPIIIFLDDEILTYEKLTDNGDGTWTLHNVYRGLIDTVAANHAAGAKLWFYDGNDSSKLLVGRVWNDVRPIKYAFVGTDLTGRKSAVSTAPTFTPSPTDRAQRPLKIDQPTINGQHGTVNVLAGQPMAIRWKLRTRVNDNVALASDDSDKKEQGVNDPLYHWQPVTAVHVFFDDFPSDNALFNSRLAWETTDGPDETVSTANSAFFTPDADITGAGHIIFYTFWYNYAANGEFNLLSQEQRIDFIVDPATMLKADFTFDAKVGFAVDFTFDYDMNITLPTLMLL